MNIYTLTLYKNKSKTRLKISADSSAHAQGQACDIVRALGAESYDLEYGIKKYHSISELFKRLAFNEFTNKECVLWPKAKNKKQPYENVLNASIYIRPTIIKYLDIPSENIIVKTKCKNNLCINPYHFEYYTSRSSKLTCGDRKLLLAYLSRGASVSQIAKVFNVNPATIYRNLKREHFHPRTASHSGSC